MIVAMYQVDVSCYPSNQHRIWYYGAVFDAFKMDGNGQADNIVDCALI